MNGMVIDSAIIQDPTGLHARPAVKVTKLAKKFSASIEISATGNGAWVNAKSVNAVMKMKAICGTNLFVRAEGEDASDAVIQIVQLIQNDFRDG